MALSTSSQSPVLQIAIADLTGVPSIIPICVFCGIGIVWAIYHIS